MIRKRNAKEAGTHLIPIVKTNDGKWLKDSTAIYDHLGLPLRLSLHPFTLEEILLSGFIISHERNTSSCAWAACKHWLCIQKAALSLLILVVVGWPGKDALSHFPAAGPDTCSMCLLYQTRARTPCDTASPFACRTFALPLSVFLVSHTRPHAPSSTSSLLSLSSDWSPYPMRHGVAFRKSGLSDFLSLCFFVSQTISHAPIQHQTACAASTASPTCACSPRAWPAFRSM